MDLILVTPFFRSGKGRDDRSVVVDNWDSPRRGKLNIECNGPDHKPGIDFDLRGFWVSILLHWLHPRTVPRSRITVFFSLILVDFAVVGFFVAFFSSLVGQILMGRLRQARSASGRAFERNSYIAFVIGGVVLISAILMTIQYIFSIVEGPEDEYGGLCDGLTFNT